MSAQRIAHIINPVLVGDKSDLFIAQPITFESMRAARQQANNRVPVDLFAVGYAEDQAIMPHSFRILPPLKRSVLDVADFHKPRKLPLLKDILSALYEHSDAEFFVYTNVDIGLQPDFYLAVQSFIDRGHDTFVINRRTLPAKYRSVDQLPQIWAEAGKPHRGWDCFVYPKAIFPQFKLENVCVGMPRVGLALLSNLVAYGKSFAEFRDVHITFHLGDDRPGKMPELADYHDHNTRELMRIMSELEQEHGPFARATIPGSFLWRKRILGRFYEAWTRRVYLPARWSRWLNHLLRKLPGNS